MANNFVMRKAGTNDPWTKSVPSDGSTLSGSATFEVKPTSNNTATYDLTGKLEVTLLNSSKKLFCNLRQKGHREEDEDPGKQYHFYFRGKADTDQSIFVGIECDGKLLTEINATNQDIADYQVKKSSGLLVRNSTFYIDIFSYYIQGTKNSSGQYVFVDSAANRRMVDVSIGNLPDWLTIVGKSQHAGVTDGSISGCTCWRFTLSCTTLTNYNIDGEPYIYDQNWRTRFPLDTPNSKEYRGTPRLQTLRVQPQFGNQKEITIKQYGGYRRNLVFGKQFELSDPEIFLRASTGFYYLYPDGSGSMLNYNLNTLTRLHDVELPGDGVHTRTCPTMDFVFKLGSNPTNTPWELTSNKLYTYIGYPWIISGLHIINTFDGGDSMYTPLRMEPFHDIINSMVGRWSYNQSNSLKNKLAIKGNPQTTFSIDIICLNDLYSRGYMDVPTKLTGNTHTKNSYNNEGALPPINIPNIVNGKRSLTSQESEAYSGWMYELLRMWNSKVHTDSSDTRLQNTRLGDSASNYLIVPAISIGANYNSDQGGIGSNGSARLNEWFAVEAASNSDSTNAPSAGLNITFGPDYPSDSSNVFEYSYDENLQFRFKIIN